MLSDAPLAPNLAYGQPAPGKPHTSFAPSAKARAHQLGPAKAGHYAACPRGGAPALHCFWDVVFIRTDRRGFHEWLCNCTVRRDMNFLRLLACGLAVSLAAGCGEPASTPTSSSSISGSSNLTAGEVTGTWNLLSMQEGAGTAQPTPAGASYTLAFADGRLSTRADCNICNGAFSLSGRTLSAGPGLACTRAACRTMEFESTYVRLLAGDTTATLSGAILELSSDRGILRFTR